MSGSMLQAVCTSIRRDGDVWLIRALCPLCHAEHRHGGGTGALPSLGRRVPDCFIGDDDYDLVIDANTIVTDRDPA